MGRIFQTNVVLVGTIVLATACLISCSGGGAGRLANASVTDRISISPEKLPTFGELRTALGVLPQFHPLTANGRPIKGATGATWFVSDQPIMQLFFGTSPVSDQDLPWRIIVTPPFGGTIAGLRVGVEDTDSWNSLLGRRGWMEQCGGMLDWGAGKEFRPADETSDQILAFGFHPFCAPIPGMPPEIPEWATYEVGESLLAAGGKVQSIELRNFHVKIVANGDETHLSGAADDEAFGRMLGMIFQSIEPDRLLESALDSVTSSLVTDPSIKTMTGPSVVIMGGALNDYLRGMCGTIPQGRGDVYVRVSDAVKQLSSSSSWPQNGSSTLRKAAESLVQFSSEFGSALAAAEDGCGSRLLENFDTARQHLDRAKTYRDTFGSTLAEIGVVLPQK